MTTQSNIKFYTHHFLSMIESYLWATTPSRQPPYYIYERQPLIDNPHITYMIYAHDLFVPINCLNWLIKLISCISVPQRVINRMCTWSSSVCYGWIKLDQVRVRRELKQQPFDLNCFIFKFKWGQDLKTFETFHQQFGNTCKRNNYRTAFVLLNTNHPNFSTVMYQNPICPIDVNIGCFKNRNCLDSTLWKYKS